MPTDVAANPSPKNQEAIVEEFEQRSQKITAIFEKMQELDGDRPYRARACAVLPSPLISSFGAFNNCHVFAIPIFLVLIRFRLVIKTVRKLEPERECYRLINNILVERTVGEVLPAVDSNITKVRVLRYRSIAAFDLIPCLDPRSDLTL